MNAPADLTLPIFELHRARDSVLQLREMLLPPNEIRPSEAASKYLRNDKGAWDQSSAPMMVEPLDLLASRRYTGIIFVGPARTGKTFSLVHGGVTYAVCCAPGDILVTQMSQDAARDFSRTEVDRVIRYSPALAERMSPRPRDDNTFDKFFRSGISLKLGWPAISQVSSKTLQYVFLTDYDRPENRDNVDGEGPLWDLAAKRVATYMSRGKCLAESSPAESLTNYSWRPNADEPHAAPPVPGILSLYNRGTRARWHWKCQHCAEFFQAKPGVANFDLPDFDELCKLVQRVDLLQAAEGFAHVACPHCGGVHDMTQRRALNASGRWVHEGERIAPDGTITGERRGTLIASYWLGGISATYARWDHMILSYLQAILTYTRSGDETDLKATTIQDQAAVYVPRAAVRRRSPEILMERVEKLARGTVPDGVRFLTAQVDVQAHRFVVQVTGWGRGLESWILDRFDISSSKRPEGGRFAAINPASYLEDWNVLTDEVMRRTYPLARDPQVRVPIRLTVCDQGGAAGVTDKAYEFWRTLRVLGLAVNDPPYMRQHPAPGEPTTRSRFALVKGEHTPSCGRADFSLPDNRSRSNRAASARGDVPVYRINSNIMKDAIAGDLMRTEPGPGFVHFADWLPASFFEELTSEVRGPDGWDKKRHDRNEAFDLHYYGRAACVILNAESIDWDREPKWIADQFLRPDQKPKTLSLTDLARALNG